MSTSTAVVAVASSAAATQPLLSASSSSPERASTSSGRRYSQLEDTAMTASSSTSATSPSTHFSPQLISTTIRTGRRASLGALTLLSITVPAQEKAKPRKNSHFTTSVEPAKSDHSQINSETRGPEHARKKSMTPTCDAIHTVITLVLPQLHDTKD